MAIMYYLKPLVTCIVCQKNSQTISRVDAILLDN